MTVPSNLRSGAEVLLDQLRIHGVDLAFGVPGESYLAVLDAYHDATDLRYVICRQEGGAAMMADAYGKLTGRPGICFVTRGPGATNASIGVHIADQDSTPMILFVGQVARGALEREAFQEIDYRRMFGDMTKWVAQIDDAARIPELVSRAFYTATSGRPGPVVLALPEDMLTDRVAVDDVARYREVQAHPDVGDMDRLAAMLAAAERPFVIVGGSGWDAAACDAVQSFALANGLPVGAAFRCLDYIDNGQACFAGHVGIGINPNLRDRVESADLLLVIGARLGEITTSGYSFIAPPRPRQKLIHVHAGADELGRVYQPDLAINAGMKAFARALAALPSVDRPRWAQWTAAARQDYLDFIDPPQIPGRLQMGEVMAWLRENLPADAILTNGAGNYTVWPNTFHQYRSYRSLLGPTAGSMGYGMPAAVAAKLVHPDRPVVCFAGDGCFLMNGQELATAVQYGLHVVVLVVNNGMFGTIRMHQERSYPGRVSGTGLTNPDFAAYARAFGATGETVESTEQFAPAFERAMAADGPALIELCVDPEALTPRASISDVRTAAAARLKA